MSFNFNDSPYSFTPGADRLLGPKNMANTPAYTFNAAGSLVQDAVQMSKDQFFYIPNNNPTPSSPPQNAPSIPISVSQPSSTSITVIFNNALVGGNPAPNFSILYGTTTNPTTPYPATRAAPSLGLYVASPTGLTPNTTYYFKSVAMNTAGRIVSAVSEGYTTSSGSGTPPSSAPTIPIVVGAPTDTTITMTFDAAGITGTPTPTFSGLIGTSTSPGAPIVATLVSGTTYEILASGLAPNTDYYFRSVASNGVAPDQVSAASVAIQTAPSSPVVLENLLVMTFLIFQDGVWQINTDGNTACGTLFLTGADAGTIVSGNGSIPTQATSINNLKAWKAQPNAKLIASFGGATANLVAAMTTPQAAIDLVDSIWNSLFGAPSTNPLSWSNAAWAGASPPVFFDGIDLDWEGAVVAGVPLAFQQRWEANSALYETSVGKKYLTMAPQTPNSWLNAPSSSGFTNGNANIPFAFSGSTLGSVSPGFMTSPALLAPVQLASFDFVFAQIYNQSQQYLTSPPGYTEYNPVFTTQMAQWAYLVMSARRRHAANTQLVWAFSSSTAGVTTPVWTTANQAQLNSAINLINPLVSAQLVADGLGPCSATEWSGGIGFWTSPTGQVAAQAAFGLGSAITMANMAGKCTMLYAEAEFPAFDPEWTTPPMSVIDNRAP